MGPSGDKPSRAEHIVSATVVKPIQAVGEAVGDVVEETAHLLKDSGELKPGLGLASGALAFTLGALCLLGVLAFWFPQYLTTPELRHKYSVPVLRNLLFWSKIGRAHV